MPLPLCLQTFCRHFCWHQIMLWPQDMPADRTLVMVSKNDDLVPGELVKKQLQTSGPGVTVWEHPTAGKPCSQ